jgi:hypothetical protein
MGANPLLPRRRHRLPGTSASTRSCSEPACVYDQGIRFLVVSLCSLGANLALLHALVDLHADKLVAQRTAIVLATPVNFLGSKLSAVARPQPAAAG